MKTQYYSFLLRLWRTNHQQTNPSNWRASLESSNTGEKVSFSTVNELWVFLEKFIEESIQEEKKK